MAGSLVVAFAEFPEEAAIIGELVVGYGELEFDIWLLATAVDGDAHRSTRVIFRVRGETQRLDLADALIRTAMPSKKLRAKYEQALGQVRFCLQIRNLYAHAQWNSEDGVLYFAHIEETAKDNSEVPQVHVRSINLELLKQQLTFFENADAWLYHLINEVRFARKDADAKRTAEPPHLVRPGLSLAG